MDRSPDSLFAASPAMSSERVSSRSDMLPRVWPGVKITRRPSCIWPSSRLTSTGVGVRRDLRGRVLLDRREAADVVRMGVRDEDRREVLRLHLDFREVVEDLASVRVRL